VKFKLEVGKTPSQLLRIASRSLAASRADLIVANDFNKRKKSHVAYIVDPRGAVIGCGSKEDIGRKLLGRIASSLL
jgi:Mg2+/Co2+ transporter CorB